MLPANGAQSEGSVHAGVKPSSSDSCLRSAGHPSRGVTCRRGLRRVTICAAHLYWSHGPHVVTST